MTTGERIVGCGHPVCTWKGSVNAYISHLRIVHDGELPP